MHFILLLIVYVEKKPVNFVYRAGIISVFGSGALNVIMLDLRLL